MFLKNMLECIILLLAFIVMILSDATNFHRADIVMERNVLNDQSNKENTPSIYNYDKYCSNYNKYEWHNLRIKGMYNTGTNALAGYMNLNCKNRNNHTNFIKNVKSTKHKMVEHSSHKAIQQLFTDKVLLLFIIKDPLTWIKSMCHHPYDVTLRDMNGEIIFGRDIVEGIYENDTLSTCINGTYRMDTYLTKQWGDGMNHTKEWNSFEQYYNEYYMKPFQLDEIINNNQKYNFEYAFVMIRFEDLLFNTEIIIKQLCQCVNGFVDEFETYGIFKEGASQREEALKKYLPKNRYNNYTQVQLSFIQRNIDHLLLNIFEYQFDI
eukprot:524913_1